MSEFDLDAYLARRRQSDAEAMSQSADVDPWAELRQLRALSLQKQQQLDQARQVKIDQLNALQAQQEANAEALANRLKLSGLAHTAVNTATAAGVAAMRAGGDLLNVVTEAGIQDTLAHLPAEALAAYQRRLAGQATAEDEALLSQRYIREVPLDPMGRATQLRDMNQTVGEALDQLYAKRAQTEAVRKLTDYSKLVDQSNMAAFSRDLKEGGFEQDWQALQEAGTALSEGQLAQGLRQGAQAVGSLAANAVSAAMDNPEAVIQLAAEQAPQLFLGAVSRPLLGAQSLGYALNETGKGREDYAKRHDGQLPVGETAQEMTNNALIAGGLDFVADASLLRAMRRGKEVLTAPSLLRRAGNIAGATAGGALIEGPTEGAQEYFLGQARLQPATPFEIYQSLVMGAATGSSISGAGRAVSEFTASTETDLQVAAGQQQRRQREREQITTAAETGRVDHLLDPAQPETYNPRLGIQALVQRSMKPEISMEERRANQARISQAIDTMLQEAEAEREYLQKTGPEALQSLNERLATLQARIANPAPDADLDALQESLATVQSIIAEATAMTPEQRKARQARLAQLDEDITLARSLYEFHRQITEPTPENLEGLLALLQGVPDPQGQVQTLPEEQRQQVAAAVVRHAMESPESISDAQLETLLTTPGFDESQLTFLRHMSAARQAAAAAQTQDGVNKDILIGSPQFKGIAQYRADFSRNLREGDLDAAQREVAALTAFARSHQAKAQAAAQALAEVRASGQPQVVTRLAEDPQGWVVQPGQMSHKARQATGSLNIDRRTSDNLVAAIQAEAQALTSAAAELASALRLRQQAETTPSAQAPTPTPEPASMAVAAPTEQSQQNTAESSTENTTNAPEISPAPQAAEETPTTSTDATAATDAAPAVAATTQPEPDAAVGNVNTADTDALVSAEEEVALSTPDLDSESSPTEPETSTTLASGRLAVLDQAEPVDGPLGPKLATTNLLAAHFTQDVGGETPASQRPLVAVANFLLALRADPTLAQTYSGIDELSPSQQQLITLLLDTLLGRAPGQGWIAQLESLIHIEPEDRAQYNYERYLQYFVDPNNRSPQGIDHNVKAAIALAAFNYLAEHGDGRDTLDHVAINRLLRREDTHPVTPLEEATYGQAGVRDKLLIQQLGADAASMLGLQLRPQADIAAEAKLHGALGAHALALLLDIGAVERSNMPIPEELRQGDPNTDEYASWPMVRVRKDGNEAVAVAKRVYDAARGSQDLLSKLFGHESRRPEPSLTPVDEFRQTRIRGTDRAVPKVLAQGLAQKQREPNSVRLDMDTIVHRLPRESLERIAGVVDVNTTPLHVVNRKRIEANNDGIRRELDDWFGFRDGLLRSPAASERLESEFFFEYEVWSPQRVGIKNRINPQQSKVHRALLTKPAWRHEIPLDQSSEHHQLFRHAVALALGVKDADKRPRAQVLEDLVQHFKTYPELGQAAELLRQMLYEDLGASGLSAEQAALLEQAVAVGGEKLHSLEGLVNWAHYLQAQQEGRETFISEGLLEVDGVNNGPILTLAYLGAANSLEAMNTAMARGGFYPVNSEARNFVEWKAQPSSEDLYQDTAKGVYLQARARVRQAPSLTPVYQAIFGIMGSFTTRPVARLDEPFTISSKGRKAVKNPLTVLMFGASLKTGVEGMADSLLQSYYDALEQAATRGDEARLVELQEWLHTLMQHGDWVLSKQSKTPISPAAPNFRIQRDASRVLASELNPEQLRAIKAGFAATMGRDLEEVLKQKFALALSRRRRLNQAANAAFLLYQNVFETLREQRIKDLIEQGQLAANQRGQALEDLSRREERLLRRALRKLTPVAHTALSARSGSLEGGLLLAALEGEISSNNKAYEGHHRFARAVGQNRLGSNVRAVQSLLSRGSRETWSAPGVGGWIKQVHSSDSAISFAAYTQHAALNLHDANANGIGEIVDNARALNKAAFEVLLEHSPPRAMFNTLKRGINGFFELYDQSDADTQARLLKAWHETQEQVQALLSENERKALTKRGITPITYLLESTREVVLQAEHSKLRWLAQLGFVNQYGLEGAYYEVTDADRARAQEKLKVLEAELARPLDAALQAKIEELGQQRRQNQNDRQQTLTDAGLRDNELLLSEPEAMSLDPRLTASPLLARTALTQAQQAQTTEPALQEALTTVEEALSTGEQDLTQALTTLPPAQQEAVQEALNKALDAERDTPWGRLGQPRVQPDAALEAFLASQPRTVRELLQYFQQTLPEQSFERALLPALASALDLSTPIHYIDEAKAWSQPAPEGVSNYRGWFEARGNQGAIVVKGSMFESSALTPELLLHELVHAALSRIVARERGKASDAGRLIRELELLRNKAQAFVQDKAELKRAFAPALKNLDEFLAWGLTNRDFQTQVLNQLQVERPQNTRNPLVTAMQAFIEAVSRLLFRSQATPKITNGLSVFLADASGLLKAAQQAQANLRESTPTLHPQEDPAGTVGNFSTQQVLVALNADGQVDGNHQARLQDLLAEVVERLHGPGGLLKPATPVLSPEQVYWQAQLEGQTPFTSEIAGLGLGLRPAEAFVAEQIEQIARAALDPKRSEYAALQKLFTRAKETLSAKDFFDGDWAQATVFEREQAQARYEAVFYARPNDRGGSDYLSRFLALGLTWQPLASRLDQLNAEPRRPLRGLRLSEALQQLLTGLLRWLGLGVKGAQFDQTGTQRLNVLLRNLAQVEQRFKSPLAQAAADAVSDSLTRLERTLGEAMVTLRGGAVKLAEQPWVKASNNALVRAAAKTTSVLVSDRAEALAETLQRFRARTVQGREGVLASLLSEARGGHPGVVQFFDLLRGTKYLEWQRKKQIQAYEQLTLGGFAEHGKYLSRAHKSALTALLRTDPGAILTAHDAATLWEVLTSETAREQLIADYERRLNELGGLSSYYRFQGANLGYYLATGQFRAVGGLLNAHNIARALGTPAADTMSKDQVKAAEALLDPLISLYALRYLPSQSRQALIEVLARENARSDGGHGVELVVRTHHDLQQKARESLFAEDPVHFAKGHTAEIFNPHKSLRIADAKEGARLVSQGWRRVKDLAQDPADPDKGAGKAIYVIDDGGLVARVTGALSMTGERTRGSQTAYSPAARAQISAAHAAELNAQLKGQRQFDPERLPKQAVLIANFDAQGRVHNYRYLMDYEQKDNLLERDNRVEKVLGQMAGRLIDRQTSTAQNRRVFEALYEQYRAEFALDPKRYVQVGPNAPDEQAREAYQLLSEASKREIQQVWGSQTMWVRADLLNLVLGYRKVSLGRAFQRMQEKELAARSITERILVGIIESLPGMGKTAGVKLRRVENVLFELEQITKEFLVVKNPYTLFLNMFATVTQLLWNGVSPQKIISGAVVAVRSGLDYQRDYTERLRLQSQLDSGYVRDTRAIEARLVELDDRLARNPLAPLVEAGMMQTLVEDINPEDETYTYKTRLIQQAERFTRFVPQSLKTAAKWAVMAHGTPLYKLMSQATMFVDLAGRYVLIEHLTTRTKNPLTREQAYRQAYEEFVAYDVPSHPWLQYLNDIGALRFTKYYIRIQKVLLRLLREHPARALALVALNGLADIPTIVESSLFHYDLLNLRGGALDLLEALPQAATFQMVAALVE